MTKIPAPYRATPDELEAIDEALDHGGKSIPASKLPAHYRAEAARLRRGADLAETVEMRIVLLEGAERFDRLAEGFDQCRN